MRCGPCCRHSVTPLDGRGDRRTRCGTTRASGIDGRPRSWQALPRDTPPVDVSLRCWQVSWLAGRRRSVRPSQRPRAPVAWIDGTAHRSQLRGQPRHRRAKRLTGFPLSFRRDPPEEPEPAPVMTDRFYAVKSALDALRTGHRGPPGCWGVSGGVTDIAGTGAAVRSRPRDWCAMERAVWSCGELCRQVRERTLCASNM